MAEKIVVTIEDQPQVIFRTVTERGLSAYEVAVANGFPGTEAEWLTTLGGAGVSDHGLLTGLADDDHPQYHTDARGDLRYELLLGNPAFDGYLLKSTAAGVRSWVDIATIAGDVYLAGNNAFSGTNSFDLDVTFFGGGSFDGQVLFFDNVNLTSLAANPLLHFFRADETPTAADLLGEIRFDGWDSQPETTTYAAIVASIVDPTDTSEDGDLVFKTIAAGTFATRLRIASGLVVGAATGGDQGPGTINTTGLYVNGVAAGGGVADHGGLTGLADDDHTQYHTDARGDARYSLLAHTHDDRYYTESEVDTLLTGKAAASHTHDDRYYTESEVDTLLAGKSATGHNHSGVYEPVLGNPGTDGYVLASTTGGTRSWVPIEVIVEASATQTLAADDNHKLFVNTGGSDHTITAPPNGTVALPIGFEIGAVCQSTGNIIFAEGSGVTINSISSNKQVKASGGGAYLIKTATNVWSLVGDLEA